MTTYVLFANANDHCLESTGSDNLSYSAARQGSQSVSKDVDGTQALLVGQWNDGAATPRFKVYQSMLQFNTSTVSGLLSSATLRLEQYFRGASIASAADEVQVRVHNWDGTVAGFVPGSSISSKQLLGSVAMDVDNVPKTINLDIAYIAISSTFKIGLFSKNQADNIAVGGSDDQTVAFKSTEHTAGTATDPTLTIVTTGNCWVKDAGTWTRGLMSAKGSGTWRSITLQGKLSSVWKTSQ
jgi:hypothetical protein